MLGNQVRLVRSVLQANHPVRERARPTHRHHGHGQHARRIGRHRAAHLVRRVRRAEHAHVLPGSPRTRRLHHVEGLGANANLHRRCARALGALYRRHRRERRAIPAPGPVLTVHAKQVQAFGIAREVRHLKLPCATGEQLILDQLPARGAGFVERGRQPIGRIARRIDHATVHRHAQHRATARHLGNDRTPGIARQRLIHIILRMHQRAVHHSAVHRRLRGATDRQHIAIGKTTGRHRHHQLAGRSASAPAARQQIHLQHRR